MISNRQELINTFIKEVMECVKDKELKHVIIEIAEDLENRKKINKGRAIGLLNQSISLKDYASDLELYCLADGYNRFIKKKIIPIDRYFTNSQVIKFEKFENKSGKKIDYFTVTFKNVDVIGNGHYVCTAFEYKELARIMQHGVITYNFNTQREKNVVKVNTAFGVTFIEEPSITKKSVRDIAKKMLNKEFVSNPISLNVRKLSGLEQLTYSPNRRTLQVKVDNKNTFLDIVDGMHRALGIMRAIENDKDLELTTMVNIFHRREDEMRKFIVQESKRNIINKNHINKWNLKQDKWTNLASMIGEYGNESSNIFYNKIAVTENEVKLGVDLKNNFRYKYITNSKLADTLKENFEKYYTNPVDSQKILKYLCDFGFPMIYGLFELECKIKQEENYIYSEGIIIAFISILAFVYSEWAIECNGSGAWDKQLDRIVTGNVLEYPSIHSDQWTKLGVFDEKINLAAIIKIKIGIKECIQEVLEEVKYEYKK